MKAILRTSDFTEEYQIVEILKNPISSQNNLALVEINGERVVTGGMLFEVNDIITNFLDNLTPKEQWITLFKIKNPNVFV